MVPVALVTISEHIGHQIVLGNVIKRDLIKNQVYTVQSSVME